VSIIPKRWNEVTRSVGARFQSVILGGKSFHCA
jgi:hypothetical protein